MQMLENGKVPFYNLAFVIFECSLNVLKLLVSLKKYFLKCSINLTGTFVHNFKRAFTEYYVTNIAQ